jgi:hypothetical protein
MTDDDTWLTRNLSYDGTNWQRDDTTKTGVALGLRANGSVTVHKVAAGSNPVGSTLPAPVATFDSVSNLPSVDIGTATISDLAVLTSAIVGADPGGAEVLRAQNLRTGVATFTGQIASTVATGTAPITVASTTVATNLNADMVDGQHLADLDTRYVNTTGDTMTGALVVGTDPGGAEVLRAQNLRAGATTLTDDLTAPSAIVGTDPGGTEALRAGSARLAAPVLTGSVPQFTMAADPTANMQVATKQYVDNSGFTITDKKGSGTGDYQTTSSTDVDVDATNLAYTVVIPSGKKVVILATGGCANSIASPVHGGIAIAEDTTTIVDLPITVAGGASVSFVLSTVVTGTGASKTYKLRFRSNGTATFTIRNSSAAVAPRLTFIGA